MNAAAPIIDIRNLTVTFTAGRKPVQAVNGVDLSVAKGEVLALLGEAGSGKSVTLRTLLRLHPSKKTRIAGHGRAAGEDVMALSGRALPDFRVRRVSIIFQEPLLALDPVYTVGQQIAEVVRRHEGLSRTAARARALALLQQVRIPSPEQRLDNFPHQMSGGMRQRAMIALADRKRTRLNSSH